MELKLGIIGFCFPFFFIVIAAIAEKFEYRPPENCDSLVSFEQFLESYKKDREVFWVLEKDCFLKEEQYNLLTQYGFNTAKDLKRYQNFKKNLAFQNNTKELEKLTDEAQKWENTFNEFMKENKDLVDKVAIIAVKDGIDSMISKEN